MTEQHYHYQDLWLAQVRRAEAAEEALRALWFQPGPPTLVQAVAQAVLGEYDSSWLEARPAPEIASAADGLDPEQRAEIETEDAHEARAQAMEP